MDEFIENVKAMRHNQKRYFQTRSKDFLITSKKYEKKVDDYLDSLQNPKLFPQ